jgi:hypothetical protein
MFANLSDFVPMLNPRGAICPVGLLIGRFSLTVGTTCNFNHAIAEVEHASDNSGWSESMAL